LVALVRTLMNLKGISQSDLAKASGVSVAAISRFMNEASDLRSDALVKILDSLGTSIPAIMKREVGKALGSVEDETIEDDFMVLLERVPPIARKAISDTLISSLRNEKDPDTQTRVKRIQRYRDSIRTVRRTTC
jgi:transcriptional regulator with XRE-family HTH domain